MYGQESPGWISLFKLIIFCCCWKYPETSFFLVKLIGQWIPDGEGRGIAWDIKKNIFIFKTLQKMVQKLVSWYGTKDNLQSRDSSPHLSLFNYPNCVTIFCRILKRFILLNFPSYAPHFAVRNSLTNQFYQKKLSFWIFSNILDLQHVHMFIINPMIPMANMQLGIEFEHVNMLKIQSV